MHVHALERYRHAHIFTAEDRARETRTLRVVILTALTMVVEVTTGWVSGSMALLADGWHMGSHVTALGITWGTYVYARRHTGDARFTFGTGKVGTLGGFTSAILLGIVSVAMGIESGMRLWEPVSIHYGEAMVVAVIGLGVNIASLFLLDEEGRGHHHDHDHNHDHNLRAAFLHVMADAVTSAGAILALAGGWLLGWYWLDPVAGGVGAVLVGSWVIGLARDSGAVLLDRNTDENLAQRVRTVVETDADNRVVDLHLITVGPDRFAVLLSVITHYPRPPSHYKALLRTMEEIVHTTVEVHTHPGLPCLPCSGLAALP